MILNPSFPGGFVTFCDDIREEVAGKVTLVGTYQGLMNVASKSPAIVPQLCALIDFRFTPESLPIKPIICVFRSDQQDPIFKLETEVPATSVMLFDDIPEDDAPDNEDSIRFHQMIVPVRISPLVVEKSFRLKIRVFLDENELRLGTLRVNLLDPDDMLQHEKAS